MGAFEEELYENMGMDEAEGAALMEDEFEGLGMEDLGDEFEDEFDEGFEADAYDEADREPQRKHNQTGYYRGLEDGKACCRSVVVHSLSLPFGWMKSNLRWLQ